MRNISIFAAAGLCSLAVPASAEVIQKSDAGFISRVADEVAASPADAWKAFTSPALWWNSQHTFSGNSANLTMDAVANGCFCEKLPAPKDAPPTQKAGSVMHMRVIYAEPYRALRLSGGLGPLQSEAINGTMTVTFKPVDGSGGKRTRILWEYVVGGFMRYKADTISGAVDKVLAEQLAGLTRLIGPSPEAAPVGEIGPEKGASEKAGDSPESSAADELDGYTPQPGSDDAAAGESVKAALDKMFIGKQGRSTP
ncbi:SRPBCC family protein [Novosphingobium sp. SL115]|uniref:SRPBCC family protein n=1 Tax=Novosphingobium sp. SL115 TaxID=2995150 RepID=UPI002273A360|nr:SRPBCC family protein [Novosphingobium sp. SL115]MCY1672479.1 SRPBCC family protein [Novosphingobium sp. SL115]